MKESDVLCVGRLWLDGSEMRKDLYDGSQRLVGSVVGLHVLTALDDEDECSDVTRVAQSRRECRLERVGDLDA